MSNEEVAAVKQLITKLNQDMELAESNRMEGFMCDGGPYATEQFTHGCLRMLLSFGAVLVTVLESYVKEKEREE